MLQLKFLVGLMSLVSLTPELNCVSSPCSHDPEVPPNAELSLEVQLLEATDAPDLELLPPAEKIALASHKRERGNVHYQRGDYAFAVNSYSIALQITESSSKGKIQIKELRLSEKLITVVSFSFLLSIFIINMEGFLMGGGALLQHVAYFVILFLEADLESKTSYMVKINLLFCLWC